MTPGPEYCETNSERDQRFASTIEELKCVDWQAAVDRYEWIITR